jgi:ABC-type multidrug transport system fused ATPase/permease subunit
MYSLLKRNEPHLGLNGTHGFRVSSHSIASPLYEPGRPVLKNISFDALPNTLTAFVGPSGAGKSTVINLIAAFYQPMAGAITVDGIDLSTLSLDSYRKQLEVVFQDTFLFDGTIRENILFVRPNSSEAEVMRACDIAHVTEFAECLPMNSRL